MSDGIDIGTLAKVLRAAFASSLAEDRKERIKWEREQWPYTLGTLQQEINLARDAGLLGRKEEPGLQDDLDNAFRMFTDITPEGALKEGLQGKQGGPASLMELYETMDLRGVIWNYGLGWISTLKEGWNIEMDKAEGRAKEFISNVQKNVNDFTNTLATLEYFKAKKELSDMLHNDYEERWNPIDNVYELVPKTPQKPKKTKYKATFYTWGKDKDGKIRKFKVGEIESTTPLDTYHWPCEGGIFGDKSLAGIRKTDYIFEKNDKGGENKMSEVKKPVYLKFNKDGSTDIPLKNEFKINIIEKERQVYE